ncbi:SDR family NAD(P)-dependent oxidoreductase [Micromonospora sp. WMMD1128]|uniref:SDR family NAD(P)-dependent oxidoreductase n=1 Tax=unclassified Micromonospora TaxID=2617518 RepID=UPI00248BD42A|nr:MULTISPECIES: SDR family oxidoreductase [unclassified Micromonospora]WBB75950.1 SDR family NAD(P)-dependent oxidoreductase [Micromonospora sp. WMMD1128]WFE36264.1 SDR family NAD(P)-dependent oxidoreductase [Micromonospora sp. WMMD975]
MDDSLTGRTAVVTGAGSGIGLEIAQRFAGEGCHLVVADLDPSACERLPGVTVVAADLGTAEGVRRVTDAAATAFTGVDILVNNVAVAPYRDSFTAIDDAAWQRTWEINVMSCVRLCRAIVPRMAERGGGSVVNIGSEAARHPKPYLVDYAVSKAALLALAKALSMEYGPAGVRVNTVAPGPTRTSTMEVFLASLAQRLGIDTEAAADHFVHEMRRLALGRMNEPADVAAVVRFLAGPASRQVTGAEYSVNAGSTASI